MEYASELLITVLAFAVLIGQWIADLLRSISRESSRNQREG